MRCEEWTERLAPFLSGELSDGEREDAHRHLAGCAACREDVASLERIWTELGDSTETDVPSDRMRARLLAALKRTSRQSSRVRRVLPWAAAAAIAVAAFLGGRSWPAPTAPPPDPSPRYVLLLHERPGSAGESREETLRVVAEYKAWAGRLRSEGKLVGGEKLADSGALLSQSGAREFPAGAIGGYFVIRATPEEAREIARTCPHVARGGTVELRRIEDV